MVDGIREAGISIPLGRIVELSGGESLRANIALVKNNARLGAAIAGEYSAL